LYTCIIDHNRDYTEDVDESQ